MDTSFASAMAGLFPEAAAPGAVNADGEREKRIKLKNCDHVAAKALEPFGVSVIDDIALDALAQIAEKGDKFAKFYSEFFATDADGGDYRQGVALSRFMALNIEAFRQLKENEELKKCLQPKVLAKAVEEGASLQVHFERLNAGKGKQKDGEEKAENFGHIKKRKVDADINSAPPSVEDIKTSAKAIYRWIKLGEESNYRMLLNFLSTGGVFYAFQAADKTCRAWVEAKNVTEDKLEKIAVARRVEAAPVRAPKSKKEQAKGGLFD